MATLHLPVRSYDYYCVVMLNTYTVTKSLSILNIVIDCFGLRFLGRCDEYVDLFFENMHTGYAEVRTGQVVFLIIPLTTY